MSDEQLAVVRACALGNVVVDSVAGSGKTTTCLLLAKTYAERNLLLTYNAKLKLETRKRVRDQELSNLEVHSYHSFCVKYYDPKAYEDIKVHSLIKKNKKPLRPFQYDRIVLDETQDMTPMLYQLFHKIYRDNGGARLCILGDKKQSIYEYKKADARYLTLAPAIFPGSWTRTELTTTYRLTLPMATFVNECMLQENRLQAVKPSHVQPRYVICDPFNVKKMGDMVMQLLEHYAPSDIFLVAYSVKSPKCPLRHLENHLVKNNVPCFVPINDDAVVDDEILQGKVALTTIHQTKGMERKVVFIVGFDSSYYKFYHKDADQSVCTNELYVATTRATEVLIMIHGHEQDYLPFLRRDKLEKYIEYAYKLDVKEPNQNSGRQRIVSVTDLLQHQDSLVVQQAFEQLTCHTLCEAGDLLDIKGKVKGETVESVTHITGSAIPAFYEGKVKGRISILEKLAGREDFSNVPRYNHMPFLLQAQRNHTLRGLHDLKFPMSAAEILFLVNCWNAETNGYLSQINQIEVYDWLSTEMLETCVNRLDAVMRRINMVPANFEHFLIKPENARVESATQASVPPTHPNPHPELKGRVLCGFADVVDPLNMLEIKCVQQLKKEHYLQLALYMYLDAKPNNYLFNVLTGELVRVQCADLPAVVELLFNSKYRVHQRCSDDQFIKNCSTLVPKVQPTLTTYFEPVTFSDPPAKKIKKQ
jgi:hypothetical protein